MSRAALLVGVAIAAIVARTDVAHAFAAQKTTAPGNSAVTATMKARGLTPADWITPSRLTGDFGGDGKTDIALLVSSTKTKKRGVLIVHGGRTRAAVAGAGIEFGNGGDDFEWANKWTVNKRKGKPDALLIEREESGGGLIEFVAGKYRWRQHGD
jgi:hypothetical protein